MSVIQSKKRQAYAERAFENIVKDGDKKKIEGAALMLSIVFDKPGYGKEHYDKDAMAKVKAATQAQEEKTKADIAERQAKADAMAKLYDAEIESAKAEGRRVNPANYSAPALQLELKKAEKAAAKKQRRPINPANFTLKRAEDLLAEHAKATPKKGKKKPINVAPPKAAPVDTDPDGFDKAFEGNAEPDTNPEKPKPKLSK